jgi:hypothetical protein
MVMTEVEAEYEKMRQAPPMGEDRPYCQVLEASGREIFAYVRPPSCVYVAGAAALEDSPVRIQVSIAYGCGDTSVGKRKKSRNSRRSGSGRRIEKKNKCARALAALMLTALSLRC